MAAKRKRFKPEQLQIGWVRLLADVEIVQCGNGPEYDVYVDGKMWSDHETRSGAIEEANRIVRLNEIEWPE